MLRAAHIALGELRAAQGDVREIIDGRRQPVRVTTQCATTYQWLPEVLRVLREREPGAEVRIETVPDDEIISALLDARIDVALVTKLDRQADRVRLQRLFDDELRAVVASRTPVGPPDPCRCSRLRRCPPGAVRELRPEPRPARAAPHPDRRPAPSG